MGTVLKRQPKTVKFDIDDELKRTIWSYKPQSLDSLNEQYYRSNEDFEALRARYAERHWNELFGNDLPAPTGKEK